LLSAGASCFAFFAAIRARASRIARSTFSVCVCVSLAFSFASFVLALRWIGRGLTRLQPGCVEDVAEAIGRVMQRVETPSMIFEFGGPRVYSYEEILREVAHQAGLAPRLIPIPLVVWLALAWASEMFPSPLLTRDQVELMQIDTVSSPEMPGFFELGISPHIGQTIGSTGSATVEHPPTNTMNRATGDVAASSQDAQKQMQGQPTAAQQSQGAQPSAKMADQGC
jgi:hypothetical protein